MIEAMEPVISGGDAKETSASRGQHAEYGGRWHGARAIGVGVGWKDSPKGVGCGMFGMEVGVDVGEERRRWMASAPLGWDTGHAPGAGVGLDRRSPGVVRALVMVRMRGLMAQPQR